MAKSVVNAGSRSVTSFEVADAAGVSQSTVSLVMSGKAEGRVSNATQLHVQETARRLGYAPNASAQILRTGVLKVIALAVPNVQQPFFGHVLLAAELAARERDYSVLLVDTSDDAGWVDRLVGMIRSRLVAGCIVYASDDTVERKLRPIRDKILLVESENPDQSGIDLDIPGAMRAVVDHLTGLDHTRIGYLAADYPKATFRRRYEAFRTEMSARRLPIASSWQTKATFELEAATRAATSLLERREITALFCDDDLLAAAAYRAARAIGIRIPEDLSVVGFNDIELARIIHPELTTVAIPADDVASASVELLLGQLDGGRNRKRKPTIISLPLHVRASTARHVT
ncbi:MAG: LacI family DNA-binding transcriptional regulator [Rhizobiaceae bacterium]|nr:LacI family DNA-binding transcriptional regulator [Rhizobiaceae bacterium]